jgi:DNA polymerase I
MDFELYPTINLRSRSFNVLQAPRELFIQDLNRNLNLQRYRVLYVCGNYSGILSKLDRRFQDLEIRRAFTVFQLMTVLEEARHSIIIVEHDPTLYEDAAEMVEYVSRALSDAAKESAVLLYSPGSDPFLEDLARNADRVWYFDEGPRASPRLVTKSSPKAEKSQTTLEAFS